MCMKFPINYTIKGIIEAYLVQKSENRVKKFTLKTKKNILLLQDLNLLKCKLAINH